MQRLLNLLGKCAAWIRLWPETWAIPIGLVGLYWSYYIVWLVFPFAVPYPPESLQKFMYAGFVMVLLNGLVWLGIKLNFFGFYGFYQNHLEETFNELQGWQKVGFLLLVYFGLLHYAVVIAGLM